MVYGILGLINFAHGDIVMIGALVSLSIFHRCSRPAGCRRPSSCSSPFRASMAICMALGITIERVAYRPLRRAPRLAPLITAIGVSILIQYTAALIWGKQYLAMPQLVKTSQLTLGGAAPDRSAGVNIRSRLCGDGCALLVCQPARGWVQRCVPPSRTRKSRG